MLKSQSRRELEYKETEACAVTLHETGSGIKAVLCIKKGTYNMEKFQLCQWEGVAKFKLWRKKGLPCNGRRQLSLNQKSYFKKSSPGEE